MPIEATDEEVLDWLKFNIALESPERTRAMQIIEQRIARQAVSVEQLCRDVLDQAVRDGLVEFQRDKFTSTESPHQLTSGELAGMANIVERWIG